MGNIIETQKKGLYELETLLVGIREFLVGKYPEEVAAEERIDKIECLLTSLDENTRKIDNIISVARELNEIIRGGK